MRRGRDESRLEKARRQTLPVIPSLVGKLVYLSSLRDFNTGHYHHAGWAAASSEEEANRALRVAHQEVFERLVQLPVEQLIPDLGNFLVNASSATSLSAAIATWQESKAYHVLPPLASHPIDRELFSSKLKAALAVLSRPILSPPPAGATA